MRQIADVSCAPAPSDHLEMAVSRLHEALAILDAIDHAELLTELPPCAADAARHQCGVSLLAVLRRELADLADDLQSAGQVDNLIARVGRSEGLD